MCTIGIKRLGDGDYVLFKNKDFPRSTFEDEVVSEAEVFGIRGVATWAESDPVADRFSGLSVGANDGGLLCGDANVAGAHDQSNYDELVEVGLRAGGGVVEGIAAIQSAVATNPYMWANIIMIDQVDAAALEIRDCAVLVMPLEGPSTRTNHHLTLDPPEDGVGSPTTKDRLAAAQRRLSRAETLDDVFDLQRAHDDGETGICSHVASQTVYSYVLRRRGRETTLYVTRGQPCITAARTEIAIPLGDRWSRAAEEELRSAYPSSRA